MATVAQLREEGGIVDLSARRFMPPRNASYLYVAHKMSLLLPDRHGIAGDDLSMIGVILQAGIARTDLFDDCGRLLEIFQK